MNRTGRILGRFVILQISWLGTEMGKAAIAETVYECRVAMILPGNQEAYSPIAGSV